MSRCTTHLRDQLVENGPEFLARDVRRIGEWFGARGLPADVGDPGTLLEVLMAEIQTP